MAVNAQSGESPLQRAHALSAQASQLLNHPSPTLPILTQALASYKDASDLFSSAADSTADEGTKKTLHMLTTQHKKLVRDLERRISSVKTESTSPTLRRASTSPATTTSNTSDRTPSQKRTQKNDRPTSPIKRPSETLGLAAATNLNAWTAQPGIASRLTPSRGVPPFALRPPPAGTPPTSNLALPQQPVSSPSNLTPFSPMYSSSSSSEPDPAESYVTFGLTPSSSRRTGQQDRDGGVGDDSADPFSHFWGMLEGCMEDISRPLVFASAPIDLGTAVEDAWRGKSNGKIAGNSGKDSDKPRKERTKAQKADSKERVDAGNTTSPSDSYYLVSESVPKAVTKENGRNASPSSKTPEELALENESLRSSLDTLALHAQQVDKQNQELRKRSDERDKMLRSVAVGVKREAQKAKQDHTLMRSQLLASTTLSRLPVTNGDNVHEQSALSRRVQELEEEVKALKSENEKQRRHVQKYKERFEKIKSDAKARKEARDGSAGVGEKDKR